VLGFTGTRVTENVKSLIVDYHVGNIILMKRNIQGFGQAYKLVRELQQLAKDSGHERPLMIGIDQENGLVSGFSLSNGGAGTQFPGAMALAATGDEELVHDVTFASAQEMKEVGINWVYSPVADVNSDHRNPVIGVRAYGDKPEEVARYASAVSSALTKAGIAPSAKHFPGHGDTHVDSHLGLPRIEKSKSELERTELVPFERLVREGIATIMTGHMALPAYNTALAPAERELPCSLSPEITQKLLRDEMGYGGVVVTDCLEMDAVRVGYGVNNGALMALQAGADIAMICHTPADQRAAIELVWSAVVRGKLDLTQSAARIGNLKDAFTGGWEKVLGPAFDTTKVVRLKVANAQLSKRAYAASIAVISDTGSVLPLSAHSSKVLVLTPRFQSLNRAVDDAEDVLRTKDDNLRNTAAPSDIAFYKSVLERAPGAEHAVYNERLDVVAEKLRLYDSVVFATRNADRATWQTSVLREITQAAPQAKFVVVATCGPYDLMGVKLDVAHAYIAAFEFTREALDAAVGVIFGETKGLGKVPVQI